MNRDDKFEKGKIYKASTNKVVCNVYMDSFPIEKVRFQNASYEDGSNISCYVDFTKIPRLAADVASGRIFKKIEEDQYHRYTVTMGGKEDGKDGKPESRIMYLGMKDDKIYVNMQKGPGKKSSTGLIMPDGQPTTKISVGMGIEEFREMILATHDWVNAYLGPLVHRLVKECEDARNNASKE